MKKLISLVTLLALILISISISAAPPPRQHGISEYSFNIHINHDGSAHIEERITNRFTGQFNGVFLEVHRRGFGDLTDLTVLEYLPATDEYIYFTQERRAREGDHGVFTVNREDGTHSIRVYSPSQDEYRTFVYRYTLTRAATRFNDAGQFDRTLIGRDWEVPIEAYQVTITFEGADIEPPYSYGNIVYSLYIAGQLRSTTTMGTNDIRFNSYMDVLLPGQSLGVDARFPAEWLPDARVTNRSVDDTPFRWGLFVLWCLIGIVVLTIVVIYFLAKPHKVDFNERYYDKLPADKGPALMAYLVRDRQLKIKDVLATLLNLAKAGVVSIESDAQEPDDYRFTRKQGFVHRLQPHEEFLFGWLFEGIGTGESVSLKDITMVGKNEDTALHFHENFGDWAEIVKTEADELEYYESYWRRTPHGELEFQKWRAFKRYLKNLSDVGQRGLDAHAFWDNFLPYALSLGSARKLMKKMPNIPKPMDMDNWDTGNMLWFSIIGPQMIGACNGVFSTTYSYGQSYASAKEDSGSGGFSASSGGGGSSGGAF